MDTELAEQLLYKLKAFWKSFEFQSIAGQMKMSMVV